jgi:nickel/cobalt exporter
MVQLLIGSVLLSLLHGLIPNHWLPVLVIGRKENWSTREVTRVTFLCGLAHALSTVLIGFFIGLAGLKLSSSFTLFAKLLAPVVLILFGLYFIYQHHRHHHFHIHQQPDISLSKARVIAALVTTMFLSPCLEIEGYFLMAGAFGISAIFVVAVIYIVLSIGGMVLWVRWTYGKSMSTNWHALEHNAGIVTGATLVATGVATFFIN